MSQCNEDGAALLDAKIKELRMWSREHQLPHFMTFELTPLCNFSCPMCYVHLTKESMQKRGNIMSGERWIEIARQAAEMGMMNVNLSGGEPFMHPEFWDIYHAIAEMGIFITVYSNGYMIDERIVRKLSDYPPKGIKLSMYGASNETYERMCGVKDGFDRFSHAVDLLTEARIPFLATTLVVKENKDDLRAMYEFAYNKGFRLSYSIDVASSAREADSTPDASRLDLSVYENITPEGAAKKKHRITDDPFGFCGNYGCSATVTWQGHMQFCTYVANPFAQIGDPVDLKSSWNLMLEQSRKITIPEKCRGCADEEYCGRCPGTLAAASGDPSVACDSFCAKAHKIAEICRKIEKETAQSSQSVE